MKYHTEEIMNAIQFYGGKSMDIKKRINIIRSYIRRSGKKKIIDNSVIKIDYFKYFYHLYNWHYVETEFNYPADSLEILYSVADLDCLFEIFCIMFGLNINFNRNIFESYNEDQLTLQTTDLNIFSELCDNLRILSEIIDSTTLINQNYISYLKKIISEELISFKKYIEIIKIEEIMDNGSLNALKCHIMTQLSFKV